MFTMLLLVITLLVPAVHTVAGTMDPAMYAQKVVLCEAQGNLYLGLWERLNVADLHLELLVSNDVVSVECDYGFYGVGNPQLACPQNQISGDKMVEFLDSLVGFCNDPYVATTVAPETTTFDGNQMFGGDMNTVSEIVTPATVPQTVATTAATDSTANAILIIGGSESSATAELYFPSDVSKNRVVTDQVSSSTYYDVSLPVDSTSVVHLDSNSQGCGYFMDFITADQTEAPPLIDDEEALSQQRPMVSFRGASSDDGTRLVCGGWWHYSQTMMNDCHKLSADNSQFEDFAPMLEGRQNFAFGGYSDGDFIVAGGKESLTAEMYKKDDNTWHSIEDMDVLQVATRGVVLSDDDTFLVCGADRSPRRTSSSCRSYKRSTGQWSSEPSLNMYREDFEMVRIGTQIYVLGGQQTRGTADDIEVMEEGGAAWTMSGDTLLAHRVAFSAIAVTVE